MESFLIRRAALTFAMIAGVVVSALSSDAITSLSAVYEQRVMHHDITALMLTPARPEAMKSFLTRVHVVTQAYDDAGNSLYVLDASGRAAALSTLQELGMTSRWLHIKIPQGEDGKTNAASLWPDGQLNASLKTSYLPSIKQVPSAVILDFSLKAILYRPALGIEKSSGPIPPCYVSAGSVLLPEKGALMNVRETDKGVLIWLVGAD